MDGMVNICELLINVRFWRQAKDADRLEPKGKWSRLKVTIFFNVDAAPPAIRQDLLRSGIYAERGNPVIFLAKGKQVVRGADEVAGIGNGRKRTPFCNEADTV